MHLEITVLDKVKYAFLGYSRFYGQDFILFFFFKILNYISFINCIAICDRARV